MQKKKYPDYIDQYVSLNGRAVRRPNYKKVNVTLFEAIVARDTDTLKKMTQYNINFNHTSLGFRPLSEAVKRNSCESLEILLKGGANPNIVSLQSPEENPYYIAANSGKLNVLKTLFKHHPPTSEVAILILKAAHDNVYNNVITMMHEVHAFDVIDQSDPTFITFKARLETSNPYVKPVLKNVYKDLETLKDTRKKQIKSDALKAQIFNQSILQDRLKRARQNTPRVKLKRRSK